MSQQQESDLFYDFDRDIIGPNRTPPLEEQKPTLHTQDTPPPIIRIDSSAESTDVENTVIAPQARKPRKRKGRTNPSFADGVLIRSLDPNQGELASHAERNPLESASQSEAEDEDHVAAPVAAHPPMSRSNKVVQSQSLEVESKPRDIAKAALSAISHTADNQDDWQMVHTPASAGEEETSSPPVLLNGKCESREASQADSPMPITREELSKKQLNTLPPPLSEGLRLDLDLGQDLRENDEDSIIKSPALAKFAIARDDAPPDSQLPALQQKSPPRSSPAGSPDHRQTLPNIKTAIGNFKETSFAAYTAMSPMGRPSPGHLGPYASPASYAAMSPPPPPGPPSHYDWRTSTRDSNTSSSSTYTSSSGTVSTPASSMTMPSPATSHPSSLPVVPEQDSDRDRQDSLDEAESMLHGEELSDPNGDEDPLSRFPGSYKCNYQGCTAAAFQTQYLLNSHMNVHSNTRTHFCPVKGCPRGPGGQGFKRKNEMIRHGLVHTSPGYICPFCPDQQHKYPRPDNLQRHVRQHHMDKDRDDPVLRDVLNQRMEGGNRGGRRRMRL